MTGPIIYVEDEPDDAFFMERAFRQYAPELELTVLNDGQAAIEFFVDHLASGPGREFRPGLVLLDLNLPGRSGLEVLREIRSMPLLRMLPVIVYTSSNQEVDIVEAYRAGCSAYVVKPRSPDLLREVVSAVTEFWVKKNQYPPSG